MKTNYIEQLISDFNTMDKYPIIEYEYEPNEFDIFYIGVDQDGIYANNTDIKVEWDYVFTLDEHLQALYELIADSYN